MLGYVCPQFRKIGVVRFKVKQFGVGNPSAVFWLALPECNGLAMALAMYYSVMSHQAAFVCFEKLIKPKKVGQASVASMRVVLAFNIPDSKWTSTRVDPLN